MARPHRVSNKSIAVAALSTVVEWYDFTLYLYFATVLSRVFFGGGEASLATTLAGFAVAYLMRPVGAVVFGHIGDRRGRRPMLLLSMMIMSVAMLATAVLPTYAQVGPAADIDRHRNVRLGLHDIEGRRIGKTAVVKRAPTNLHPSHERGQ